VERTATTPGPRSELGGHELAELDFARRWTEVIGATVPAGVTAAALQELLADFTARLRRVLTAEVFDPAVARQVGRELVENDLVGGDRGCAAALERSIRVVGEELLPRFGLEERDEPRARLVPVLAAVAAGYGDALSDQRERTRSADVHRLEEALRASEARFRAVFGSSAAAIVVSGLDGRVIDANDALRELLGHDDERLRDMSLTDLVHPDDRQGVVDGLLRLADPAVAQHRDEVLLLGADGEAVAALLVVSAVRDPDGAPVHHVSMAVDVDDVRALQSQLLRQSLNDVQTGFANRAQFVGWLENATGTRGPEVLALLHVDLDGFGVVNNAFGHEAGDRLLVRVAGHLRDVFDGVGQVARIGADEFGVLIRDPADTRAVIDLAEQAVERVGEALWIGEDGVGVTASVGVVVRPARGGNAPGLLRAAALALGWAKRDGGAQWALYDERRDERERERHALAASVPGALENGEFCVEYEPVRSLSDHRLVAVEAHLRWNHPRLGVLPPERFLEPAARTGAAVRLGSWLLERACAEAGGWHAEFGDRAPVLSVDLGQRQCQDPELVGVVLRVLRESGLPANRLRFELDERLPPSLGEDQVEALEILTGHGVGLLLDQRGGAGVDRPHRLPLSGVRFGGAAVHGLAGASPAAEAASAALLSPAARVPGVDVFAGDVRSPVEERRLAELGVAAAQGPHLGGPMTADEVREALAARL
jgi:diguanylate cyclase (GGDEF)-like protein/PAS domain S-box-containing protein